MSINIETERLYIREIRPEDEQGFFEMDSDPEVHRYIAQKPLTTIEDIRAMMNYIKRQYRENGVGRWSVVDKTTGEFLGWTGFKLMKDMANGHINHYDFGYRLKWGAWGKGIATEAGRASLKYGLEELGLDPIYAMTHVDNAVSRHILEKLGFRFVELFEYSGPLQWGTPDQRLTTWYELPRK